MDSDMHELIACAPSNACIVYLINLDRSPERLANVSARLTALGLAFERVPAVDGMTLSEAEFARQTRENRYYKPLRRGEVGCYLSHLEAMRRFVATGREYALILEDDVVLPDRLPCLLNDAIGLRRRSVDARLAWDVLKLANKRRRHIDLAPLGADHRLVEYGPSVPTTTAAAVWTRDGAIRWIQGSNGVARPIDCDLQHPWEYGLCIRSIHPVPVAAGTESTMGSKDHATRAPWRKLAYEASRLVQKWRYFTGCYGGRFMLPWLWRTQLTYRPVAKADGT